MAVDTANKRSSAINVSSPWRGMLPLPDSTVNQADRQHTNLMYSGILAASPPAVAPNTQYPGKIVNVSRLMGR